MPREYYRKKYSRKRKSRNRKSRNRKSRNRKSREKSRKSLRKVSRKNSRKNSSKSLRKVSKIRRNVRGGSRLYDSKRKGKLKEVLTYDKQRVVRRTNRQAMRTDKRRESLMARRGMGRTALESGSGLELDGFGSLTDKDDITMDEVREEVDTPIKELSILICNSNNIGVYPVEELYSKLHNLLEILDIETNILTEIPNELCKNAHKLHRLPIHEVTEILKLVKEIDNEYQEVYKEASEAEGANPHCGDNYFYDHFRDGTKVKVKHEDGTLKEGIIQGTPIFEDGSVIIKWKNKWGVSEVNYRDVLIDGVWGSYYDHCE